jgi:two-component system, response regulator
VIAPSAQDPTVQEGDAEGQKPVVWLVEDNIDDERLTVRALSKTQFNPAVTIARDGERALELVDQFIDSAAGLSTPKLVLLDLKLPKASGFEVLESIRANVHLKEIPVVILTSSDEPMDVERAWALGANDYVRKPVDYQGYLEAISSVTKMWLPAKEPV